MSGSTRTFTLAVTISAAFTTLAACSASSQNAPQMLPAKGLHAAAKPATTGYSITDLGALPGDTASEVGMGTQSVGFALNDAGQAAGASSSPTADIATLFSNGGTTNINTLNADVSLGNAINASGQVAGEESQRNDPCGCFHAFVYSNGTMQTIDSPSQFPAGSIAYGINKSGQVVGQGFLTAGNFHAFLYSGGKMIDLNPFNGYQSNARSINDSGTIVGGSTGNNAATWIYSNGTFTVLSQTNSGVFINNSGQIVGENSANHATLYNNGTWTDLGGFPGAIGTSASGINSSGQIVGVAGFKVTSYHPFKPGKRIAVIFTSSGAVDLNTLVPPGSGFTLTAAISINDSGQIAAEATIASGAKRAVLLTPK